MKKKYQVSVTETFIGYVDCEADSMEQALRIAEEKYRKLEVDFGHHDVEYNAQEAKKPS